MSARSLKGAGREGKQRAKIIKGKEHLDFKETVIIAASSGMQCGNVEAHPREA